MRQLESQSNLDKIRPETGISSPRGSGCRNRFSGLYGDCIMKTIELTQGKVALVDNEDYQWLNQWKWCVRWNNKTESFYAMRHSKTENSKRKTIYMAREILGLKYGNKHQADHIDHNTLNNCISNLRIVTNQKNHFNQRNTKGYYWQKASNKYHARIGLNGKKIHLGYFCKAEEARKAYLNAKKIYHKI